LRITRSRITEKSKNEDTDRQSPPKIRNRVNQIPQARPADLSAFRYRQNVSIDVALPPNLPLANPAAKRGSRTIMLVAKNRKIRRVNLRDSSPLRDSRGGDQRELSK